MKSDNKIIIVEPSQMVMAGLLQFLSDCKQISVVSQLENIDRLEEKILAHNPDLLIINPLLVCYDQGDIFSKICGDNEMKIVALVTSFIDQNVLKHFNDVIQITDSKQKVVSLIFNLLNDNNIAKEQNENVGLSNRESEVLVELAKGMTNKEISDKLCISIHTVITHRKNIIRKTGIKSVSGLTVYALLNNLVDESEIYLGTPNKNQ